MRLYIYERKDQPSLNHDIIYCLSPRSLPAITILANLPPTQLWEILHELQYTVKNMRCATQFYNNPAMGHSRRRYASWIINFVDIRFVPVHDLFLFTICSCSRFVPAAWWRNLCTFKWILIWEHRTSEYIPIGHHRTYVQYIPIWIQRNTFSNLQILGTLCWRWITDWKTTITLVLINLPFSITYICVSWCVR